MRLAASSRSAPDESVPAAPVWHTASVVLALVAIALGELVWSGAPTTSVTADRRVVYVRMLVGSLGFAVFASGLGQRRRLLSKLWSGTQSLLVEVLLAGMLLAVIVGIESAFPERNGALLRILPATREEQLWWCAVALVVACSEELVYRAYLRPQLARLFRSGWLGVLGQAALFGLGHATQGPFAALRIGAYGALLGWLAWRRGNITACALCHVAIDGLAGLCG